MRCEADGTRAVVGNRNSTIYGEKARVEQGHKYNLLLLVTQIVSVYETNGTGCVLFEVQEIV